MYLFFSILKAITVQKTSEKAPQPHCAEKNNENISNKRYDLFQSRFTIIIAQKA